MPASHQSFHSGSRPSSAPARNSFKLTALAALLARRGLAGAADLVAELARVVGAAARGVGDQPFDVLLVGAGVDVPQHEGTEGGVRGGELLQRTEMVPAPAQQPPHPV